MNWVFILLSVFWPVVQPAVQQGVQRVQQRMQHTLQQPSKTVEQVPQYYSDGQNLYCHWNGQWWIWRAHGRW